MASRTKKLDREKGVVSDIDRVRIRAAVRGPIQRKMARNLIRTDEFSNPQPSLVGKARRYASSYVSSYHNFAERVQENGVELEYDSGPYGGDYSSSYKLKNYDT